MIPFFKDRFDAGEALVEGLIKYKGTNAILLALPRGGVPVAFQVAKALQLPLDLILTKKIGHPANREYAIGAVSNEDIYLNPAMPPVPAEYVQQEVGKIRKTLTERYERYMRGKVPISWENRIVILVDDGLATGSTMMAAITMARKHRPAKVVVAVPVSAYETAQRIKMLCDEFYCPHIQHEFWGVGQFYEDFEQVRDEEVIHLMKNL